MTRQYKTALGKPIDIEKLRLANEETIAVGNMKVNARGDELGAGGRVVKSRNQVMDDYYKLNTPTAVDNTPKIQEDNIDALGAVKSAEPVEISSNKLRGSLASSIAKE